MTIPSDIGPIELDDTWHCSSRSTVLDGIIMVACMAAWALIVWRVLLGEWL